MRYTLSRRELAAYILSKREFHSVFFCLIKP
jgi:hypothetical protein